jgi:hypothetical protein
VCEAGDEFIQVAIAVTSMAVAARVRKWGFAIVFMAAAPHESVCRKTCRFLHLEAVPPGTRPPARWNLENSLREKCARRR